MILWRPYQLEIASQALDEYSVLTKYKKTGKTIGKAYLLFYVSFKESADFGQYLKMSTFFEKKSFKKLFLVGRVTENFLLPPNESIRYRCGLMGKAEKKI